MISLSEQDTEFYKALVNEATENAVKWLRQDEKDRLNKKYDRRLHNTELLLRNYINIKEHATNAVYTENELTINELKETMDDASDLDNIYINSILKTKKRTAIMIDNINKAIDYYNMKCISSKKEDVQRRIQVVKLLYIEGKTPCEVAEKLFVEAKTVGRAKKEAIKDIAPLLFGIDGIDLY